MAAPIPTPIYRFMHIDNLDVCLQRRMLHAPNHTPDDGLIYRTIHNVGIQQQRRITHIPCGPGGVIHDYVSFYLGPRSPMMLQLHTGQVEGYNEGQEPLVYVVSTAQAVDQRGDAFVFSDGHGIAHFTGWYDNLEDLDEVDWVAVRARYWQDTIADMDKQRRKQAEFLVHRECSWDLISEIGVLNTAMEHRVQELLATHPVAVHRPVVQKPIWYY